MAYTGDGVGHFRLLMHLRFVPMIGSAVLTVRDGRDMGGGRGRIRGPGV